MRKVRFFVTVLLSVCILLAGTAAADYGYTSVSAIPMAVDFTYSVEFDSNGFPHIVTDYPFEAAGANEMNLVYDKGDIAEAITLRYRHATGTTSVGTRNGDLFPENTPMEAYRMIRSGELTPDGYVYINTSNYGPETSWVLVYSVRAKNYTEYRERTHGQGFNAMGSGGTEKDVYYEAGEIISSRMIRRTDDADLMVEYDPYGNITYASVTRYGTQVEVYDYDPSTGLFSGKTLTELGFEESDLETEALAALGSRTGTVVAQELPAAETAVSPLVFTGSLLTGILIGLALFRKLRRRRDEKKKLSAPETGTDSAGNPGATAENTAEPPVEAEPPKTFSAH